MKFWTLKGLVSDGINAMLIKKKLNGCWQFSESGKSNWREAKVPGCVQMDLMTCGELTHFTE